MRISTFARRKSPWFLSSAIVILLYYKISRLTTSKSLQIPVLKKSFVRGGRNILYGPFVSEAYNKQQSDHSITYVTHTSTKNLYHLQLIDLVWDSPISVAVWAHAGDLTKLIELVYILTLTCAGKQALVVSILLPSDQPHSVDVTSISWEELFTPNAQTCSQRSIHNRLYELRATDPASQNYNSGDLPYPNNCLRNVALSAVRTSHVIVSDIDILPSVNMDGQFLQYLHGASDIRKSDVALVVPVFESKNSQKNQWTMARLLIEWQIGQVRQFYEETCPQCQGPTQYSNWIERQTKAKTDAVRGHVVPYVPGWEPFIIMRTNAHPKYDERFQQFGYNRMSVICELHLSGRGFQVLDGLFLVHDGFKVENSFHADKDRELQSNELLYQNFVSELTLKYNTKRQC